MVFIVNCTFEGWERHAFSSGTIGLPLHTHFYNSKHRGFSDSRLCRVLHWRSVRISVGSRNMFFLVFLCFSGWTPQELLLGCMWPTGHHLIRPCWPCTAMLGTFVAIFHTLSWYIHYFLTSTWTFTIFVQMFLWFPEDESELFSHMNSVSAQSGITLSGISVNLAHNQGLSMSDVILHMGTHESMLCRWHKCVLFAAPRQ